jgi:hypothetical protein
MTAKVNLLTGNFESDLLHLTLRSTTATSFGTSC